MYTDVLAEEVGHVQKYCVDIYGFITYIIGLCLLLVEVLDIKSIFIRSRYIYSNKATINKFIDFALADFISL